ncbi:unnamed protein product [Dicrocoelium dendriticum]|nr:unnamed protein product [Dicrocoelium dendriticum]
MFVVGRSLGPCLAPFFPRFVTRYTVRLRRFASKQSSVTVSESTPHQDCSNVLLHVHDPPLEGQWAENPELEYANITSRPVSFDFVQPNEFFQLNEIRQLLKQENVRDLIFIKLPPNHICTYMVIGSGMSRNHVRATASVVYRILKYKRRTSSLGLPRLNGLDGSCEWIAMNLGNILLHLFLPPVREYYDLEGLWAAGPEYDEYSRVVNVRRGDIPCHLQQVDWDQLIQEVQQRNYDTVNSSTDSRLH